MIDTTSDEAIDAILDRFNFEKAHKAMLAVGWVWTFPREPWRTPTPDELRKEARRLLEDVARRPVPFRVMTGGLCARSYKDGDAQAHALELSFILEEWEENFASPAC